MNWPLKTSDVGYVNRNGQTVLAATDLPGTDHLQKVYRLRCLRDGCDYVYGANGSDIHERKCPECQDGMPGEPLVAAS